MVMITIGISASEWQSGECRAGKGHSALNSAHVNISSAKSYLWIYLNDLERFIKQVELVKLNFIKIIGGKIKKLIE